MTWKVYLFYEMSLDWKSLDHMHNEYNIFSLHRFDRKEDKEDKTDNE